MILAKEIEDRLNRAKRRAGDFPKDGVPTSHGTVPEAGEFQGLELSSVLRFWRDEAGVRIDKRIQVKGSSQIVPHAANDIERVEVGGRFPHGALLTRFPIYLR